MKIQLKRTGGFTGIPLNVSVDADQYDEKERAALSALVEAAQFFSLPEKIQSASPGADRFLYRITVETPEKDHTVEVGESVMPDSLQPLIMHVISLGRAARKQ